MRQYLKRRLLTLLPVIFGVVTAVFLIIHLIPGDPAALMLSETANPADIEALRTRLGLDRPLGVQYYHFWANLFRGNLGESIYQRQPVFDLVMERFPNTALLAVCAVLVSLVIAFPLGIFSALRQRSAVDYLSLGFSILGISMPVFWLGPLLILIFAVQLHWLPVTGMGSWKHLVLPSLTLGFGLSAITIRMIRSSMIEVMNQDYIRTAFAKGLGRGRVVWKHALKNVMIPVITIVGLQLGALFGGVIITEKVFSYPGLGSLLITAIRGRDYPLVQGAILVIALTYIGINLLVDLLYSRVDPKIRLG
ncbi:MAG: ABC transporter permease [Calditrichaceae bacterium]|nr:ABC transporter permease [Calditrichia bacterium]NUQ40249.1 ABC transporter permease [Calditrichaceae bacterium]